MTGMIVDPLAKVKLQMACNVLCFPGWVAARACIFRPFIAIVHCVIKRQDKQALPKLTGTFGLNSG